LKILIQIKIFYFLYFNFNIKSFTKCALEMYDSPQKETKRKVLFNGH